ncbi:MAG TPA: ABC transporter permease [Candidatus Limnocylindrales bacterium]
MSTTIRNTLTIALREFSFRGRTRVYVITTAVLVLVSVAVAMIPIGIRYLEGTSNGDKIGVYVDEAAPEFDVVATTDAILNAPSRASASTSTPAKAEFIVSEVTDLAAARADVKAGSLKAVLALGRTPGGDLGFTLYSDIRSFERTPQLIQQAATSLATQDRLARQGIPQASQGALFAPPTFAFRPSVEDATAGTGNGKTENLSDFGSSAGVGFALSIFIFMAIMLYGQWVAMSVAEEKSSRVMELILGAATPFQLMAGKVLGVGSLALLQMVVVLVPAAVVVLFQGQIAATLLGQRASTDLPAGLTVELLVAFGVLFVLGFGLYATLYAGAASLVSRQEDVNQMIAPLTLLSTGGYLVAVYTSIGLIDLGKGVFSFLSYVPFLTPYLMLGRIAAGDVQLWEPILGVVVLAVSVVGALWVAARLYSAGVLMYGQKPGFRSLVRAIRTS